MVLMAEAERKRLAEGKTNGEFAEALGVSPGLWSLTKSGKKPLRRKLVSAIVRRYDDLRPLAVLEAERYLTGS